ncbi:unnamed protein product [Eruca vesicaria subsp. sativa]|uniref:Cystatin domain-containing protein n=1 Tax=Eruca vesicaria subsp. sativa TaxID=29727 RepID=A0ABC8M410_ERUVS|nr:unnamed protein product [Eruca vesicaria subsp. sativa]
MENEEDNDDFVGGCEWKPIEDIKDPSLEVIAKFAISEYNKHKDSRLNFQTVVSGDKQLVGGINYRLVLNVNDGCNEGIKIYEVELFEQAWNDYRDLIYVKPIN